MFGRGGHGSRPEVTVDPVVMAAATVLRLQTIVSREVAGTETAILTVGALRAGTKENIIPDDAELLISLRTFDPKVRQRVLDAISRIVHGEAADRGCAAAAGGGADRQLPGGGQRRGRGGPDSGRLRAPCSARTGSSTRAWSPAARTSGCWPPPPRRPARSGCSAAGTRRTSARRRSVDEIMERLATVPSNHSPQYAPVPRPTIDVGVAALVSATREWLPVLLPEASRCRRQAMVRSSPSTETCLAARAWVAGGFSTEPSVIENLLP